MAALPKYQYLVAFMTLDVEGKREIDSKDVETQFLVNQANRERLIPLIHKQLKGSKLEGAPVQILSFSPYSQG